MRALGVLCGLAPLAAHAFCGFYVAGGGASLFNDATQVALMREGTRTVLSMQNSYRGPPEAFAMVVPVPIVLQKENVKTLPKSIFDKLDQLAAPRLVEYWEQDPCPRPVSRGLGSADAMPMSVEAGRSSLRATGAGYGVTVEAKFEVGEYDIVVLGAEDALGLERWLTDNRYNIPRGAQRLLGPYIQQGMKFFVAKVDPKKVTFVDGQATLSPLRFHYDSEKFELPVRLGLINAKDKQDLIVHVLAKTRYEVANAPNVTIPTNVDLVPSAKSEFGPFYASLFDKTLKKTPGAVVTEYAWASSSCDPCPTPPLQPAELQLLGLDVLPSGGGPLPVIELTNRDALSPDEVRVIDAMISNTQRQIASLRSRRVASFVITRLHARYDKTSLGEDLVFKSAGPIAGGREHLTDGTTLEQGAVSASTNTFQARYAIRYPWKGAITCAHPQRGIWGGPPSGAEPRPTAAQDLGQVTRDDRLAAKLIESPVPELELKGRKARAGLPISK